MDCSLRGSSIHGISQARVLDWVAISFSRESSPPRNRTWVSLIVGRRFKVWATREALCKYDRKLFRKFRNSRPAKTLSADQKQRIKDLEQRFPWKQDGTILRNRKCEPHSCPRCWGDGWTKEREASFQEILETIQLPTPVRTGGAAMKAGTSGKDAGKSDELGARRRGRWSSCKAERDWTRPWTWILGSRTQFQVRLWCCSRESSPWMTGTAPSTAAPQAGDGQAAARSGEEKEAGDPGDGPREQTRSCGWSGWGRRGPGSWLGEPESRVAEEQHPAFLTQTPCSLPLGCIAVPRVPRLCFWAAPFHLPACTWAEPCVWKGCCLKLLREQFIPKLAVIVWMLQNTRSINTCCETVDTGLSIFDAVT